MATYTVRFSEAELKLLVELLDAELPTAAVGRVLASRFRAALEDGPDEGVLVVEGIRQPRKAVTG